MSTFSPDLVCLTETWLTPDTDTGLIKIDGFCCVRSDRTVRRGGGSAIYVREGIPFQTRDLSASLSREAEGVLIELTSAKVAFFCIYIPPSLSPASLSEIRDNIVNVADDFLATDSNNTLIIAGDFNHFKTNRLCSDLDLIDIVHQPTRGNHILDHILISRDLSDSYTEHSVTYNPPIGKADHKTLIATPQNHQSKLSTRNRVVYDFRLSNINNLLQKAYALDWTDINTAEDVNSMWTLLHAKISSLIKTSIPCRTVHTTQSDKSWITPLTKALIDDKWAAFRLKDWATFNHLKEKVRQEVRKAKEIWAAKLKNSTYGIWQLTKHLSGKSGGKALSFTISEGESLEAMAEKIADELTDFESPTPLCSKASTDCRGSWNINFSTFDIARRLKKLPANKAPGSDGIPNRIYAALADIIATPLKTIYERSIAECEIPHQWKEGITVPIPKTNPPQENKVRLITLLPVPSKILERLVLDSVRAQLEPLFGDRQHAFRKGCSTSTALLQITDKATQVYDSLDYSACAIMSFDLSKAFDKVNHHILLKKLTGKGLPNRFVEWIRSYLTNRTFRVRLQDACSKKRPFRVGVPQGSVLGPALFCVMVGDFACADAHSSLTQYADDFTIVTGATTSEIHKIIQEENTNFTNWCNLNKQQHNTDKSQLLILTRHPISFEETPLPINASGKMKILGVQLNNKLTWHDHVDEMCKKASKRLRILRVLKPFTAPEELHQVYVTSIRSVFDYACTLFVGLDTGLSQILQRIDKRAHRIMHDKDLLCTCNNDSLRRRREVLSLKLFHEILGTENHILRDNLPSALPSTNRLRSFHCRTVKRQRSFFPKCTILYNQRNHSQWT